MMAAAAPKPSITILHSSFSELPDEKGQPQPLTHIVYRDERGIIGTIIIHKKDPSDSDVKAAILKQREEEKARKPHTIPM